MREIRKKDEVGLIMAVASFMRAHSFEKKEQDYQIQIADICRQRLLGYAESFKELAMSYMEEYKGDSIDRQFQLENRRNWENRQVLSSHLQEMASIMRRVAKEEIIYEPLEPKIKKKLEHALREENIQADSINYIFEENGKKAIGAMLCTSKKGGIPAEEVADMISVLLHKSMQISSTSPYLVDQNSRFFLILEEPKYIALTGFAKAVKENEIISGDNYSFLQSGNQKLTMMLSDGTGSGEKAGKDSGQVLDLMEKLLDVGFDCKSAAKMVNSALFAKGEDSNHPTLDLCTLDLNTAECNWCKVGGAVSFVKRGNQVETISAGNLPLGIFQQIEPYVYEKKLQDGDYIIMISDGILDAFMDQDFENTIASLVEKTSESNPGEIAEKILHTALIASKGRIYDDMTVTVAGIWETA